MTAPRRSGSLDAFSIKVDTWIAKALADGVTVFADLLRRLPGVYPTELLASLDRLEASGSIDRAVYDVVHYQARLGVATGVEGRSLLPPPHPLDFEWRFTADASRGLLDNAAHLTPDGGDILLFGTPGLGPVSAWVWLYVVGFSDEGELGC